MRVLPPLLTESLFTHVVDHALRKGKPPDAVRITKREREITVLIAEGMSNKEIAQRLDLSTYTVKSHIHNILRKIALHSRWRSRIFLRKQGNLSSLALFSAWRNHYPFSVTSLNTL